MMNYADYDFYTNEYKGSLSIDLFNSLIIKASREIDKNVNKDLTETNIERLTEREQWQLNMLLANFAIFLIIVVEIVANIVLVLIVFQ